MYDIEFIPHIHGMHKIKYEKKTKKNFDLKYKDFMPHIHVWHRVYATHTCMT